MWQYLRSNFSINPVFIAPLALVITLAFETSAQAENEDIPAEITVEQIYKVQTALDKTYERLLERLTRIRPGDIGNQFESVFGPVLEDRRYSPEEIGRLVQGRIVGFSAASARLIKTLYAIEKAYANVPADVDTKEKESARIHYRNAILDMNRLFNLIRTRNEVRNNVPYNEDHARFFKLLMPKVSKCLGLL